MMSINDIDRAIHSGALYARELDYAGPDPYDGLSSPAARLLPDSKLLRQMWLQGVKRAGQPARTILRIPRIRMAKSLALFSEGLYLLGETDEALSLSTDLLALTNGGPWGYEFDVQTRWAYYPAGTPNVIATAFSVRALVGQGLRTSISSATLEWLYTLIDDKGYLHYTPTSNRLIHNGNLLAAETIARLGGDREVVQRALEVTLGAQRADGSWPYGEGPGLEWVDNFHSVYVLESLWSLSAEGFEVSDALSRGLTYWREQLFDEALLPRYLNTSTTHSNDVHNVATVVGALAIFPDERCANRFEHPALQLLLNMQQSDGSFRSSGFATPFMRWNQAHAFRALARWRKKYED